MKTRLTKEMADELLEYRDGNLYWKRSLSNNAKIGSIAGCVASNGYAQVRVHGKVYKTHRVIWLIVYGEWPSGQIDHVNGIRSDNRLVNLRDVTASINQKNRAKGKNNTSGHLGIRKSRDKWRAFIKINGRDQHIGTYENINHAIWMRKVAEVAVGYHPNHGR